MEEGIYKGDNKSITVYQWKKETIEKKHLTINKSNRINYTDNHIIRQLSVAFITVDKNTFMSYLKTLCIYRDDTTIIPICKQMINNQPGQGISRDMGENLKSIIEKRFKNDNIDNTNEILTQYKVLYDEHLYNKLVTPSVRGPNELYNKISSYQFTEEDRELDHVKDFEKELSKKPKPSGTVKYNNGNGINVFNDDDDEQPITYKELFSDFNISTLNVSYRCIPLCCINENGFFNEEIVNDEENQNVFKSTPETVKTGVVPIEKTTSQILQPNTKIYLDTQNKNDFSKNISAGIAKIMKNRATDKANYDNAVDFTEQLLKNMFSNCCETMIGLSYYLQTRNPVDGDFRSNKDYYHDNIEKYHEFIRDKKGRIKWYDYFKEGDTAIYMDLNKKKEIVDTIISKVRENLKNVEQGERAWLSYRGTNHEKLNLHVVKTIIQCFDVHLSNKLTNIQSLKVDDFTNMDYTISKYLFMNITKSSNNNYIENYQTPPKGTSWRYTKYDKLMHIMKFSNMKNRFKNPNVAILFGKIMTIECKPLFSVVENNTNIFNYFTYHSDTTTFFNPDPNDFTKDTDIKLPKNDLRDNYNALDGNKKKMLSDIDGIRKEKGLGYAWKYKDIINPFFTKAYSHSLVVNMDKLIYFNDTNFHSKRVGSLMNRVITHDKSIGDKDFYKRFYAYMSQSIFYRFMFGYGDPFIRNVKDTKRKVKNINYHPLRCDTDPPRNNDFSEFEEDKLLVYSDDSYQGSNTISKLIKDGYFDSHIKNTDSTNENLKTIFRFLNFVKLIKHIFDKHFTNLKMMKGNAGQIKELKKKKVLSIFETFIDKNINELNHRIKEGNHINKEMELNKMIKLYNILIQ